MAPQRNRRKFLSHRSFGLETLESRQLLTSMGVGTPVGETAGILIIEGNGTSDDLRISLDTKNNTNPNDDQIIVQLKHDGITEQEAFNLYEGYGPNRHLAISSIAYIGLGGHDRVTNLTNLNINASEFPTGQIDHNLAIFSDPLTGRFNMHGTDQADTAEVHIGGLNNMYVTGKIAYGNSSIELTTKRIAVDAAGAHPLQEILFHGNAGDDTFTNNTNVHSLAYGEQGNDTLIGGSGNDALYGDSTYNYHWLYAGAGNDTIDGRGGNDFAFGGNGVDNIHGGDGDDELDGGYGDDSILCDAGNDTAYGHAGNDHVEGGDGNDKLWGDNWCELTTDDNHGDDFVNGGNGDDVINGGSGNDTLLGGAGNDRLLGRIGNDLLIGGAGDDKLFGEAGNDTLYGGLGDDVLYGDSDEPQLYVSDDVLYGGDGNDELDGGNGNNQLTQNGPNFPQIDSTAFDAYFSLIGTKQLKRSLR